MYQREVPLFKLRIDRVELRSCHKDFTQTDPHSTVELVLWSKGKTSPIVRWHNKYKEWLNYDAENKKLIKELVELGDIFLETWR